jgi:hypothetical protein
MTGVCVFQIATDFVSHTWRRRCVSQHTLVDDAVVQAGSCVGVWLCPRRERGGTKYLLDEREREEEREEREES